MSRCNQIGIIQIGNMILSIRPQQENARKCKRVVNDKNMGGGEEGCFDFLILNQQKDLTSFQDKWCSPYTVEMEKGKPVNGTELHLACFHETSFPFPADVSVL